MRAIVNKAFTPKAVKELEPHIEEVTAFYLTKRNRKNCLMWWTTWLLLFPSLSSLNFRRSG
ncbi:hypothetical protein PO124_18870 [Bacillus licheniformis]|nr:hypothetical protein [Bacillus licheniformis]